MKMPYPNRCQLFYCVCETVCVCECMQSSSCCYELITGTDPKRLVMMIEMCDDDDDNDDDNMMIITTISANLSLTSL